MRGLLLGATLAFLPLRDAAAQGGATAAAFLQRPLGARAAALGGAFCAVSDGPGSLQYNPAGTIGERRPELHTAYLNGFGGSTFGWLAWGQPLPIGTLTGGFQYFDAGSIDLNLSDGTKRRVSAEQDHVFIGAYAVEPLPGLAVGAAFKYLRSNLADTAQATATLGDLGVIWRTPFLPGLSAGGAVQNVGPDIKYESEGDPPPRTLRYGLAYRTAPFAASKVDPSVEAVDMDLLLTADVVQTLREKRSARFGTEIGLAPGFINRAALRFGWIIDRPLESFTFGLGFREGRFLFDYAFSALREFNPAQQISVSVRF